MTTRLRTTCTRDCPDACGLIATVDDAGRVTRLQGDPEHPITRGFLCYRVGTHYLSRHHSQERLTTPLVRRGDRFEPISWQDALDLAAERLDRIRQESGAAAIVHVQGGGSLGILKNLNHVLFRTLGCTETRGDVCDAAGSWAQEADFGAAAINALEDAVNAKSLFLWGKNVASSSPHSTPILKEARARGARTWLIDPLPHQAAQLVDRHVSIRPGGDAALAFAVARIVLDHGREDRDVVRYTENFAQFAQLVRSRAVADWCAIADVPTSVADEIAAAFTDHAPVTTWIGWGLQRRVNGATQVRAIDALHLLTGNVGRAGAGASFTVVRRSPFDLAFVKDLAARVPRTLQIARLGAEIEAAADPPIRAVVIDNGNMVATNPDSAATRRALESRDFTLVLDPFLTDTARAAHLVLPTTTMLEEDDLVGSYGHHFVSASRAVARRPDGVLSDLEIYQALADRLGVGEPLRGSAEEWCARMSASLAKHGFDRAALLDAARRAPGLAPIAFSGRRFATESGRARFVTEYRGPDARDAERPLTLHGLSTGRWQTSQLTDADEEREGELTVTCHPDVAGGVADGGAAWLESALGALPVVVRHDADYRKDTVYAPRARQVRKNRCVNQLVRARVTDFGEGAAFYDEGVRLRPRAKGAAR